MRAERIAVVDVGTNSTRLLVAEVAGGEVRELERRTNVTRLGEGVDSSGRLDDAAMQRVYEVVAGYREAIDRLEAERVVGVATSAVRDASNGADFGEALAERFAVDLRTISGDEEARLTFLGATAGRPPEDGPTLVIDIGGGSTELVIGIPGADPDFHVSTRLGSVRHTERHLREDPPKPDEVAELSGDVEHVVRGIGWPAVSTGIAVAGTPTSLAAIDQELDPYDPERVHGYRLTLAACERMLAMLAAMPLERRRRVTGLHPDRAPTIVAGTVILVEAMRAVGLSEVETSEADILHGAALAAAGESGAEAAGGPG